MWGESACTKAAHSTLAGPLGYKSSAKFSKVVTIHTRVYVLDGPYKAARQRPGLEAVGLFVRGRVCRGGCSPKRTMAPARVAGPKTSHSSGGGNFRKKGYMPGVSKLGV